MLSEKPRRLTLHCQSNCAGERGSGEESEEGWLSDPLGLIAATRGGEGERAREQGWSVKATGTVVVMGPSKSDRR